MKKYLESTLKWCKRMYTRFMNYNNTKKWFILYLFVLAFFLLFFPIVKISHISGSAETYGLLSLKFIKSLIVILISLLFLLGWNMSAKFKKRIIDLFALREDEPLVDFALLWVITSVFMGIVDTISIAKDVSGTIDMTVWAFISQLLLLAGLIWAFVIIWQSYKKATKQTKIFNIVSDESQKDPQEEKKNGKVQHLFEDLENEEE